MIQHIFVSVSEMWAILSGIEGNLAAYQAVMADIEALNVDALYILGDVVGPHPDCEALVQEVRRQEAQICMGWWEEQCLSLYALGANAEPTELIEAYGASMVNRLWNAVSRETVEWLRSFAFGFFEDDILLVHGSSIEVSEELNPETPPWQMLDRLQRVEAKTLFCGRSGQVFEYELQSGSIATAVTTLTNSQPTQTITRSSCRVIGVGSVGRNPHQASYTLFDPNTQKVEFRKLAL